MKRIILMAALVFTPGVAFAQLSSNAPEPGKTCTAHWQECVDFNKNAGAPTNRCDGYRSACMKEGRWRDRNRHFFPVQKK